jgi:hypothetical protein
MPKPGAGMPPEVVAIVKGLPSTTAIVEEVVQALKLEELTRKQIGDDFDLILQRMMDEGLRALTKHQVGVAKKLIDLYVDVESRDPGRAFSLIQKGFSSLGNQRKKRAGVHMERCVKWLLDRCGIANENAAVITGQSDLVVPSAKVVHERPERAVVLEFKTTTRERWKEVRDEIARTGKQVWLLTLDDYISDDNVALMAEGKITLYVPERVYKKLKKRKGHLRSLKTLIPDLEPVGRLADR